MVQIPQNLATALSTLSDRVRIIPVADDEPGTCIIEMPDEIIDASASTQLNNLRGMLMDLPGGGTFANLN
jgi:flagellar assembly protein FliH